MALTPAPYDRPRLDELIGRIIQLHASGPRITLLAACPNSVAVLEAAVKTASLNHMPMLFAATLNQVDRDGGYTGWTPREFVEELERYSKVYSGHYLLYPCLDHGGPWLKDAHTRDRLTLQQTMDEVKTSLNACIDAGYSLLHVDPTVDRTLPPGQPLAIDVVVERTVEMIASAEAYRQKRGLPPISYEVGTEEVHGGLVDFNNFDRFLTGLQAGLERAGLSQAWPCFIVGKVGTDLHTTFFDPEAARRLYQRVAPLGSLIKGHYTDWVENPAAYPATGMGGANVGPEFTATELAALEDLNDREQEVLATHPEMAPSNFRQALESAVVRSGRWRKWLLPDETGREFAGLSPDRRAWLVSTGARYVWTDPEVLAARRRLYDNLRDVVSDPNAVVVDRIVADMQKYVDAFNLRDSMRVLVEEWGK